jgi:transcriptional regulator of heat shock response
MLILLTLSFQSCLTEHKKKPIDNSLIGLNGLNESFKKTGWIAENKYRAVVFIITDDECKNSSITEIEERIRFEAYKNLQKELNPTFNRNASNQIKTLADTYGKMVQTSQECATGNVYFYDLEQKDLKSEFEKIKNLK